MLIGSWKKHPVTGAWFVYAPGAASGDSVTVVAASGKCKRVQVKGETTLIGGNLYAVACFGEYLISASNVPLPPKPEAGHPLAGHPAFTQQGVEPLTGNVVQSVIAASKKPATHKLYGVPKATVKAHVARVYKAPPPPKPLTRTQKARGVKALAQHEWQVPQHTVLDAAQEWGEGPELGAVQLPAFARPCPMTPQHGFVDSRVVETREQLEQVRQETIKKDPKGELLLMPFLTGKWSAIVTPAGLAIGPGHSAATEGHGKATSILLTDAVFQPELLQSAGVDPEGMPYCEIVEHQGKAAVVQLRSGPAIPRAKNYIPKQVPVCYVVDARPYDDLLEWQRVAKKLDPNCTAVICSDLLCHQAAHCTSHGIAVVTDGRELTPGMVLKPEPMPPPDVQAFWEGLHYGMPLSAILPQSGPAPALTLALLALHQKQFMLQTAPGARLAGLACRTAVGIAAAACHGEARHKLEHGLARHQVFTERYPDAETDVHFLEEVFLRPIWGGSYGGKKWAACTVATVTLRDAVRGCLSNPSQDSVHACFDALNMVVNVSHNGGLFLTKFGATSNFDGAAQAKAKWIAQTACSAVWIALTESIALPCSKDRKVLRSEDPKLKPKVPRTYQVRARFTGSVLRVQSMVQGLGKGHTERDFPATKEIEKAWEACKDNATLLSLVGTGAVYVPCFIRGRTLYLKPKSGWYVSTGLELPESMCPPTKKAKKAAHG